MSNEIRVAVIGAGMAGKAHAAAFRSASTLYSPVLPPIKLVSIADMNPEFGSLPLAALATNALTLAGRPLPRPTTLTLSAS